MKRKTGIILSLVCILCILLGVVSMYTPKAKNIEEGGFSTIEAKKHIKEIAKKPHSIYDKEALGEVRNYIIGELKELGLDPEVFNYKDVKDRNDNIVEMNNIFAKIDGKNGENGQYILLATHYDSSPKKRDGEEAGSLGAADAGYGISTILEILRVIKASDKPLDNGIKILITDGEEMGLLGAKQEMNSNFALYENVSYVVNIEARGVKGPALMFETSDNNKKVIELYKNANLPVSYSLAADIYSKMPNGSDFTEFKNKGLNGINFAVLNSLDYYHTPRDNYDNVSDTSLQHYGDQILPVVEEFIYSEKYSDKYYFNAQESSIFFTLLPNVFISYTTTIGIVLAILAIIAMIFITKVSGERIKLVGKWTGIWGGVALGSVVSGLGISYIISLITGIKFKITYMPKVSGADLITLISIIILITLVGIIIKKQAGDVTNKKVALMGALWFNTILLVIFMFALPGGSYLFLWPILTGVISIMLINKVVNKFILLLPLALTIIMYVPVIYNIYIALTIGALGVVLLLSLIAISLIVSIINYLTE